MKRKLPPTHRPVTGYQESANKRRKRHWPYVAVLVLLLALVGIGSYRLVMNQLKAVTPSTAQQKSPPPPPEIPSVAPQLEPINNLIAAHPDLDISVAIVDIKADRLHQYGLSEPFVAASTGKILTAALYLRWVEQGRASLNDSVGRLPAKTQLEKMLVESDNVSWHAFNDDVLGHAALQDYAKEIGLKNYTANGNLFTTEDMATLLNKLYTNKLLKAQHTNLILSYMNSANEYNYIVAAVPDGLTVYHKAGWLRDRVHDAAIIDNGKRPYVLVIFTKTQDENVTYNTTVGKKLFHDITDTTITAFSQ